MDEYCFKSTNMASLGILIIFAVIGGRVGDARSFVNLHVIPEVNGRYGHMSVLKCTISTSEELPDPEITWLSWTKVDVEEPLLLYSGGHLEAKLGYSLDQKSWKSYLDVSLRIDNTTLQHEGEYTCEVSVNTVPAQENSRLKVTARYGAPTISSGPHPETPNGDHALERNGGYLEGRIHLVDEEGKAMKDQNSNGALKDAVKIVTPLVVIGSCIVGLLLVLLVSKWRHRQRQSEYHENDSLRTSGLPMSEIQYEAASKGDAEVEDQETADV